MQNDEITFYFNPQSRARITKWMLEETGAKYKTIVLDFEKAEHKKPEYLALNPMGKVPTIVHRGVVVTEVAAICAYLADAFPDAKLAPAVSDPSRGTYYRWLFFAAGCIEPAMTDKGFNRPPVERKSAIGYGSFEDVVQTIDQVLSKGTWLVGDSFTAADLVVGAQLGWGVMQKTITPTPAIGAYLGRIRERPAFASMMG